MRGRKKPEKCRRKELEREIVGDKADKEHSRKKSCKNRGREIRMAIEESILFGEEAGLK